MKKRTHDILAQVADYYTSKLADCGPTPNGVDWNGEEGQVLRFEQLCKVVNLPDGFSINDVGCGYGALYDFLCSRYHKINYHGCDVSTAMILAAQTRCAKAQNASFTVASEPSVVADYGIASGIFNVRLGHSDAEWQEYLKDTLSVLNNTSRRGFAFNCLTSFSDADKRQSRLYYADPCYWFDFCKRNFSKYVVLRHDYPLWEFTLSVTKEIALSPDSHRRTP